MKIFELEKYRDKTAFIDENGEIAYYRDVLDFAERIGFKIGVNKHIYMKALANMGMLIYYIAFLYTDNVVQVVDKEIPYEQHLNYIRKYRPEYICEEVADDVEYLDQLHGYGIRKANQKSQKVVNKELRPFHVLCKLKKLT